MKNELINKINLLTDNDVELILKMINNNDIGIIEKYYELRQKEKEFWTEHTKNWSIAPWHNTTSDLTNYKSIFATNSATNSVTSFATNDLTNYKSVFATNSATNFVTNTLTNTETN